MKPFLLNTLVGVLIFFAGYLTCSNHTKESNFASGGVESSNTHLGSREERRLISPPSPAPHGSQRNPTLPGNAARVVSKLESGSSAPPAGNTSEDLEWQPNPDRPLRPQLAIYASSEPKKAVELALRIPWADQEDEDEAIFNDPIGTVMRVWAKDDPKAATVFYESMTDPQRQLGAAFGLVEGLAVYDVERAANWTEKQIVQRHPDSVAFISHVVPHMQIERAKRWLAGLPLDDDEREMTRGLVSSRPRRLIQTD